MQDLERDFRDIEDDYTMTFSCDFSNLQYMSSLHYRFRAY